MSKENNTGDWNTGNWNTGNWNTGNRNTGNRNTGDRNTGNWNTGNRNTGNLNTGDLNTGNRNTGDLNTTNPKLRLFNKDSDWEYRGSLHYKLKNVIAKHQKPLCEWVSESFMSEEEKEENKTYKTTGGYLKVNENNRNKLEISEEDREFLKSVPNFDNAILKECTGIDLVNENVKIVIDGKEIWISKESAKELREAFIRE